MSFIKLSQRYIVNLWTGQNKLDLDPKFQDRQIWPSCLVTIFLKDTLTIRFVNEKHVYYNLNY